jgi:cytidine deaminase
MCRQVISEFATENTLVLLDGGSNDEHEFLGEVIAFDDLLPWQFEFER